jgi:hypothetical protein
MITLEFPPEVGNDYRALRCPYCGPAPFTSREELAAWNAKAPPVDSHKERLRDSLYSSFLKEKDAALRGSNPMKIGLYMAGNGHDPVYLQHMYSSLHIVVHMFRHDQNDEGAHGSGIAILSEVKKILTEADCYVLDS